MIINTNREEYNYDDDHYEDVKSEYSRLKVELSEIRMNRAYRRKCRTWDWDLEIDFRDQQEHLLEMIQEETGIY